MATTMTAPVPPPSTQRECCLYSFPDTPKPITNAFCVDSAAGCPSISGWQYLGYFFVPSCGECQFVPPAWL